MTETEPYILRDEDGGVYLTRSGHARVEEMVKQFKAGTPFEALAVECGFSTETLRVLFTIYNLTELKREDH